MAQFKRKQIHNQIPLPEHLSWKFSSIVEIMESWRVIHTLLSRRYLEEEIQVLFPAMDNDYFQVITEHFKQHGAVNIEEVIKSLLVNYRERELKDILERMIKLEGFSLNALKLVTPNKSQERLLSTHNLIEMSKKSGNWSIFKGE